MPVYYGSTNGPKKTPPSLDECYRYINERQKGLLRPGDWVTIPAPLPVDFSTVPRLPPPVEEVQQTEIRKRPHRHRYVVDYLNGVVDPELRATYVQEAIDELTPHVDKFDAIAVTGFSGSTYGAILAHHFGKAMILVRKPKTEEHHHATERVEGPLNSTPLARYLIVDDFKCSGSTVERIQKEIGTRATYVGVYFWKRTDLQLVTPAEDTKPAIAA